MRQEPQPFPQQGIDFGSREVVTDLLQALGIGTRENAVVERLKRDAFLRKLALGVFVTVQAELGIEGKVAAELEKEWPKIPIERVDVLVVDRRAAAHDPRIRPTCVRAPTPLSAENRGVLLGFSDKDDPLLAGKAAQMVGHHFVLALPLAEPHQRNSMLVYKSFQLRHKAARHRAHQGCRRQRLAAMLPEEPDNPLFVLEIGHIDVEVHPVDSLNCKLHMTADYLRYILC
jgi:hypothetical protein